jgi:hypothetical protein
MVQKIEVGNNSNQAVEGSNHCLATFSYAVFNENEERSVVERKRFGLVVY